MKIEKKVITRRDFLRESAYAALIGTIGFMGKGGEEFKGEKKVKVILVRHQEAFDSKSRPNYEVIQLMLDQAVTSLTGKKNPVEAWRHLINPKDIVGIKSNVWRPLATPKEVEKAIKKRLVDVGVPKKNIGIDDRGIRRNPIFKKATALINVRPLRTHHWSGIGGCIKNYIQFVSLPWTYHGDSCANLAAIWHLPRVKGKTRLNILLVLSPLFHGIGPHHYNPAYVWPYKGMLVGKDPVALDAVGVHLLQAKRRGFFGYDKPLTPPPKHILVADHKYKLGISNLNKIELVRIGWRENILI
ncbi:MAG: DUF362 domain-containing protein [Candidatus Aminicenantia bacterium]